MSSDAPVRRSSRQLWPLSQTTRPRAVCHTRINRSQADVIAIPEAGPPPAAPRTSSSTPTRARTARRRGIVARTGCTCATAPTSHTHLVAQIVLLGLRDQNLRLLRQTRHVREARRPAARTAAHEALLRFPMEGLRADEARLALRVVRAFLGRDRDGLRVLLICVVLLSAACFFYFLQSLSWPPSCQCCTWHSAPQ